MVARRKRRAVQNPESLEARILLTTITVTSLEDNLTNDNETTLREAIAIADETTARDTIVFASGLEGTIRLSEGQLLFRSEVELVGPGSNQLTIDATNATNGMVVVRGHSDFSGFTIANAPDVGVQIGGSNLEFNDVHFVGNGDAGLQRRDLRFPKGNVTVVNSEFRANQGQDSGVGGAIQLTAGVLTVQDTSFIDNESLNSFGGAIRTLGVAVTVEDSVFVGNRARWDGGAIFAQSSFQSPLGSLFVSGSQFSENVAGRNGGAIGSSVAQVDIVDSVFNGNYADERGGALHVPSGTSTPTSMANTTISGNEAGEDVGGAYGLNDVVNSTIVQNVASDRVGGLQVIGAGAVVESSIIAQNTAGTTDSDADATGSVTFRTNLIGVRLNTGLTPTGSTPDANGNLVGSDNDPLDPQLLPLGAYGTSTLLHPLMPGSLAVDQGSNPFGLQSDQQGGPRSDGAGIDIGATEMALSAYLEIEAPTQEEDSGTLDFQVRLIGDPGGAFQVTADTTTQGTAGANDFTPVNQQLSFSTAGQVRTVSVVVAADSRDESDETVQLRLSNVTSTNVAARTERALATIVNDDIQTGIHIFPNFVRIRGATGADIIEVDEADGVLTLRQNETTRTVARDAVQWIEIFSRGGNDNIAVRDTAVPNLVAPGSGNDTVKTGLGPDTILGSSGNDNLRGTMGADIIEGGAGDDTLNGQLGNDTVLGNDGDDSLIGDDGDDLLNGGGGADSIRGGDGRDTLVGGAGDDSILGEGGTDTLRGEDGNDTLLAGNGDDFVSGADGNDFINGSGGDDTLHGERGNDTITGSSGRDVLSGSAGNDSLDGGNGIDTVLGSTGNDILKGGRDIDRVLGGGGNDTLLGGEGDDSLEGQDGRDSIRGGNGTDTIIGGNDADTILGDAGNDMVDGGGGADSIVGGIGLDVLVGGQGRDTVRGGDDGDVLIGGSINDSFTLRRLDFDWHSGESYDVREEDVRTTLRGGTRAVFVDGVSDELFGDEGRDVFWVEISGSGVDVFDLESNETRRQI